MLGKVVSLPNYRGQSATRVHGCKELSAFSQSSCAFRCNLWPGLCGSVLSFDTIFVVEGGGSLPPSHCKMPCFSFKEELFGASIAMALLNLDEFRTGIMFAWCGVFTVVATK